MHSIDFSPLYRSTVGFDRLASLLDESLHQKHSGSSYSPYNIELVDENQYAITLAVAGFDECDLELQVENGVLTVSGSKPGDDKVRTYLYQGIANRNFVRKFDLADHVEIKNAKLKHGMLTINLAKESPEAMKPRKIPIGGDQDVLEDNSKH